MVLLRRYFVVSGLMIAIVLTSSACTRTDRRSQAPEPPTVSVTHIIETPLPPPSTPSPMLTLTPAPTLPPSPTIETMPTNSLEPSNTPENVGNYSPGDYTEQIVSGGQARQYRLHVPPSYEQDKPVPLVINLHGYNSNAEQQEHVSQMSVKADQESFIAVYPEGLGSPQTWHVGPGAEGAADLQFISDLIRHLQSRFNVDRARIYATGISNGAQMANRLGCELSDVIAAIAPVSGGYPPTLECYPVRPVPVVAFHGTADRLIPYEGQGRLLLPAREWATAWAARNGCNPTPTLTFQHGEVTGETWSNCQGSAEVTLYTIEGRGHSWPGSDMPPEITTQDIDATDVIWKFFEAHPMP
jgi:polyhydroxybutyrate depolymerase